MQASMSKEYEIVLQGTRKEAVAAVQAIREELARNGSKDPKTAQYTQFKLGLKVLHSLCYVLGKQKGVHTDIYCNIVIDVTGPCMRPEAAGTYWSSYLECLRYIHYQFLNLKLYELSDKIFALFRSIPDKLQSESDYKLIIGISCQHLYTQRNRLLTSNAVGNGAMDGALEELAALFTAMLTRNRELNFQYPNVVDVFMSNIIPKHTVATFSLLASLPAGLKVRMFEAFFELLANMKAPHPKPDDMRKQVQAHLQALSGFIQMDGVVKLEHKFALEHLKQLRPASWLKCDEAAHYTINMMYYYVRSTYTTVKGSNLKETYIQVSAKLSSFLKRLNGNSRADEEWFADFVVVMSTLQGQMQQKNPEVFSFFWQEINSLNSYKAHFELILSLIELAANMNNWKLGALKCCTNVRQHTILSFAITAVGAYSSFMLTTKEPTEQSDLQLLAELNRTVTLIFRAAITAIQQLDCLTGTTGDLKMFYARYAQLTRDVVTPRQAKLCVSLGELLVPIKHKVDRQDWTLMLRRIYKTAIYTKNDKVAIDIHACYLTATLANVQTHGDSHHQLLQNQLNVFYGCFANGTYKASYGKCVLDLYAQSGSVFKEPMAPKQKSMLLWLEMQNFFVYERKNVALQQSLMSLCTSEYDYILLARGGKLQDVVACSLKNICYRYSANLEKGCVPRLERLIYAHACFLLLSHENEKEKTSREVDMNYCMEDQMATLLEKECVRTVRLDVEIARIKLAEEALQAFEEFFNKADAEPISADEALIDWEALLEDLGTLALYLQLAGFVDVTTRAWLLHYKISNILENIHSAIRGLSYFCEYAHALKETTDLCLEKEVNRKGRLLWSLVKDLAQQTRRQQNCTLICLCQLAYYVAYKGNLPAAMLLLKQVKARHEQLADRGGKYDVVLASMDTVRFRIVWKHLDKVKDSNYVPLAQRNLLCEIDELLEKFRFIHVNSGDFYAYCILLFTLVQDTGECSANRMWDSAVYSFMPCVLKMALQMGCALRAVQVVTTWAMLNLQQEYVRKAEIKLKLCEYFLCVVTVDEVLKFIAAQTPLEKPQGFLDMSFNELLAVNSIATMRKEAYHPSSPIKTTGQHTTSFKLQKFLDFSVHNLIAQNEILQWCYFMLGCLNARLLYLVADYTQLTDFHKKCHLWLQQRSPTMVLKCFQHYGFIQLRQHINYLRAIECEEESQKYIAIGLKKCIEADREVDSAYYLNFRVQLIANQQHLRSGRRKLFCSPPEDDTIKRKVSPPSTSPAVSQTPHAKSKIYPAITPKIKFAIYDSEEEKEKVERPRRRNRPQASAQVEAAGANTSPDCSPPETYFLSAAKCTAKTPKSTRKPSHASSGSVLKAPKAPKPTRGIVRRGLDPSGTKEPTDTSDLFTASIVLATPVPAAPRQIRGRQKKVGTSG